MSTSSNNGTRGAIGRCEDTTAISNPDGCELDWYPSSSNDDNKNIIQRKDLPSTSPKFIFTHPRLVRSRKSPDRFSHSNYK